MGFSRFSLFPLREDSYADMVFAADGGGVGSRVPVACLTKVAFGSIGLCPCEKSWFPAICGRLCWKPVCCDEEAFPLDSGL
jgi:hypothetical protein